MKKGFWVSLLAGTAAVAAAAVAVTAFIRKKSQALSEHLDYDPDEYFENDECDDNCCDCCGEKAPEEDEEETLPLHPEEVEESPAEEAPAEEAPAEEADAAPSEESEAE